MEAYERNTCSFIVKVWLEEIDEPDAKTWRGHITHVFNHKRRYVEDLDAVTDFIAHYLKEMGAKIDRDYST